MGQKTMDHVDIEETCHKDTLTIIPEGEKNVN